MLSAPTLASFFLASLLLGFAPGPDIVFVLAQSAVHGARAGLATTAGLVTGLCWHTALVSLGVAALIAASPVAFTAIKIAGALYLLYLAVLSWRASAVSAEGEGPRFPGYGALYRRGIVMNVTNPKVTMFFLAFLPQFCDPDRGSVGLQCVLLGAVFMLAAVVAFTTVSLLAGRIFSRLNRSAGGQRLLNRVCSFVFAGLALLLLVPSD